MTEKTIYSFYAHDHDELDGYLKKFQELKTKNYPDAKEFFKKFKFGLQRHIVWEEELLFPLFEEKTGLKNGGPTEVMRLEHRQIKEALENLHKKVQRQDPDSNNEEEILINLLSEHNNKEESILYPAIDRSVSDKDRQDVFGQMAKVPESQYKTCNCSKVDSKNA